jgi:Icc protein
MLIAQLTDCHIVEPGGTMADRVDPTPGLEQAVEFLDSLGDRLDLVLATGDLVNDGTPAQYDQLERILSRLRVPLLAIPGNHDDRTEFRRRFPDVPAGGPDEPIDHVVDRDELRLVCLDTNEPGLHSGRLAPDQLAWLDAALSESGGRPTLVVQHHPPFASGIASMDRYGLDGAEGEAEVLARHHNVIGVVAGHYHRAIHHTIGGTTAFACPSTAVQLAMRLDVAPTTYSPDPPALALHALDGMSLSTHVVQLVPGETWVPSWDRDPATAG